MSRTFEAVALALYAAGALLVIVLCLSIAGHYTPFDSSGLRFLHYRLANHHRDAEMLLAALAIWTIGFLGILIFAARSGNHVSRKHLTMLVVAQAVLCVAFALLPIAVDSDQFAYVGYAYAASHGDAYDPKPLSDSAAPAERTVAEHWGNPLPRDAYGGAWTTLNAALLYPLAGSSVASQTAVLRAVAVVAALGVTLLLATIFGGDTPFVIPLAFALNPLVLLEAANGAHNDIFVALGGVAAMSLALRRRFALAGVALGLAAGVKFAYVPFIAILAAYAYATGRRVVDPLIAIGAFVSTILLVSLPYGVRQSLVTAPRASFEHKSGALLVLGRALGHLPGIGRLAAGAIDVVMPMLFLLCIAILTVEVARGRFVPGFAVLAALIMLTLAGKIEPWYTLMATPLVVAGRPGLCAFVGITSGASVLIAEPLTGSFAIVPAFAIGVVAAAALYAATDPGVRRLTAPRS